VAVDGHELDIIWPLYNDVVGSREVDHLEVEHLGVVAARISENDVQIDLFEGMNCLPKTTS
jgi:hypothetical protein